MIAWLLAIGLVLAGGEPTRLPTPDGAEIVVHRRASEGPPVLLVHGVSSNHRYWDLAPGLSLAEFLSEAGFDVWNLDLRGHGDALKDASGKRQSPTFDIDDYGEQDVAVAVAHIRAETGAARVHYVGHSMGGMVLAVYLATHGDQALASAVVVGSPLDLRDPDRLVAVLLGAGGLAGPIRRLPTPMGAKGLALLKREAPGRFDELLYNPANFDPKVEGLMLRSVVSPLTRGEIAQLSRMADDPNFRSAEGEVAWRHVLEHVEVPMLFLAGRADRVVSPERVLAYFDAVGSGDKAFLVLSQANGFSGDYGHLGTCCARAAREEVFPLIGEWLAEHPGEDR